MLKDMDSSHCDEQLKTWLIQKRNEFKRHPLVKTDANKVKAVTSTLFHFYLHYPKQGLLLRPFVGFDFALLKVKLKRAKLPHHPLKENVKYYGKTLNHVYFTKYYLCIWWGESGWLRVQRLELLLIGLISEWLNLEPPKFITDTH